MRSLIYGQWDFNFTVGGATQCGTTDIETKPEYSFWNITHTDTENTDTTTHNTGTWTTNKSNKQTKKRQTNRVAHLA